MDRLTREQYTSPWWSTHPDNTDGPSALALDHGDDDLVRARRRRTLHDAQAVDNPVDEETG